MVDSYSATTYDSTSTMLCVTGYEGTPADITCTAGGTWSSQTGCSIVGKYYSYPTIGNLLLNAIIRPWMYVGRSTMCEKAPSYYPELV